LLIQLRHHLDILRHHIAQNVNIGDLFKRALHVLIVRIAVQYATKNPQ